MPPYWFIFDLDETLTHVNPFIALLCTFFREEVYKNAKKPEYALATPDFIRNELQNAYQQFIQACAQAEVSDSPLGILRPGIIPLFRKIAELKDTGLLGGCLIYSNNMLRKMIEFIRDVIHAAVARDDLFCDTISRHDTRRLDNEDRQKTLATIQRVIQEGSCRATAPPAPTDIFFFDDIIHPDLKDTLGPNYIRVKAYEYRVSLPRLIKLYKDSLRNAGILDEGVKQMQFFDHIGSTCLQGLTPYNDERALSIKLLGSAKNTGPPPPPDGSLDGIMARLDTILAAAPNTLGNNPLSAIQTNALAGGRRRKRSSRKTKKASRKNRRNNRTKWRRQRA